MSFCVLDHCSAGKVPHLPSFLRLGVWVFSCSEVTYIGTIQMSPLLHLLHSCSPISAHLHLHSSQSALCSYCVSSGQTHAKHVGPHLIQRNVFQIHLTSLSGFFSWFLEKLNLVSNGLLLGQSL